MASEGPGPLLAANLLEAVSTIGRKASNSRVHDREAEEDGASLKTRGRFVDSVRLVWPRISSMPTDEPQLAGFETSLRSDNQELMPVQSAIAILFECTQIRRPIDSDEKEPSILAMKNLESFIQLKPSDDKFRRYWQEIVGVQPWGLRLYDAYGRRFFTASFSNGAETQYGLGLGHI